MKIQLRNELSISNDILININWLSLGVNTITVHAIEGTVFKDYICTVTVTVTLADYPSSVGLFNGDNSILDANSVTYRTSQDVTIILGNPSSEKAFIDNIDTVKVNGSIITDYISSDDYGTWNDKRGYTIPSKFFTTEYNNYYSNSQ